MSTESLSGRSLTAKETVAVRQAISLVLKQIGAENFELELLLSAAVNRALIAPDVVISEHEKAYSQPELPLTYPQKEKGDLT